VLFADGRKVTTLDEHWGSEGEPEQPILESGSGGGSPGHYDSEYWLWPLPPPGPLVFVCEWAAVGIAETRTEIDPRSTPGRSWRRRRSGRSPSGPISGRPGTWP